jgi:hypothetical protein
MHTTNQILDTIAAKHDGATDYRLAKIFGTSSQTVAHWRKGRTSLSLDYAIKAAALLDWDAAYVVACVEHERAAKDARLEATDEIRATWERIAQRFKPAAAILAAFMLLGALSHQGVTSTAGDSSRGRFIHYAKYARRWLASVRAAFWRIRDALRVPFPPLVDRDSV